MRFPSRLRSIHYLWLTVRCSLPLLWQLATMVGEAMELGCCLEAVGSLDGSQHVCGEEVFETDALVAMVGHDPPLMQWRFLDDCYGHAQ